MPEIVKAAGERWSFLVVRLAFQGGTGGFLRSFPSLFPVANGHCGVGAPRTGLEVITGGPLLLSGEHVVLRFAARKVASPNAQNVE